MIDSLSKELESIYESAKPNITKEEINKRIEIFLMFLSFSETCSDVNITDLNSEFKECFDLINRAKSIPSSNIILIESTLKLLYYVLDKKQYKSLNITQCSLGNLYKKLDILEVNNYPDRKNYYDLLMQKNEYGEFYSPDDPKYAENYFLDKKEILPYVRAYSGRNAIVHKNLPAKDKNKFKYDRILNMIYTCIEVVYKYNNVIINKYIEENLSFKEYIEKNIKRLNEKYSENFSYIPLNMHIYENDYYSLFKDINALSSFHEINKIIDESKLKLNQNTLFNKAKLIGYAGIGKTTTIEHIIREELETVKKHGYKGKIPVMIELVKIKENNEETEILELISKELNVDKIIVSKLLQKGLLNLYIDGINELRITSPFDKRRYIDALENFILSNKNTKVIITDRDNNDMSILNDYPTFVIDGVSEDKIESFILGNSSKPEIVNEKVKEIIVKNPYLKETMKNAFMLKNLITIIECNAKVPDNEDEIAESFLKAIVKREEVIKRDYKAPFVLRVLIYVVALDYNKREELENNIVISYFDLVDYINDYISKYKKTNPFDVDEMIDLIVKLGILKKIDTEKFTFVDERYYNFFYYSALDHGLIN